jgi:hypothetical protein
MFIVVEPLLSSDLKHGCNKPPPRKPQLLQRSPSLIKKIIKIYWRIILPISSNSALFTFWRNIPSISWQIRIDQLCGGIFRQ